MPYAIKADGWRAVGCDFTLDDLLEGENLVDQVSPELVDMAIAAATKQELIQIEAKWQADEILFINNQLMALEEGADALLITREQWLPYRTRVRNWKEGADGFPYAANRPWRPK